MSQVFGVKTPEHIPFFSCYTPLTGDKSQLNCCMHTLCTHYDECSGVGKILTKRLSKKNIFALM